MNRLRAAWDRLWGLFRSRWERPEPKHTARPAEPSSEPEREPEGPSPKDLTVMDFPPPLARPYVKPDEPDGPKHRKPR